MIRLKIMWCFLFFLACCFLAPGRLVAEEVLTWADCVKEALANHPELIAAKEKVIQSEADVTVSKSSALPNVTAQLSDRKSKSGGNDETTTYAYSLSGDQLLFDGFKTRAAINAAHRKLNAEEYDYLVVSSSIRLSLRVAFSALLKAQQLIALTEDIAKRRKENLKLVEVRYKAGREHKGAVLAARADLAQADFEVAQSRRNLSLVRRQLVNELGRPQKSDIIVTGDFKVMEETQSGMPDYTALADSVPLLKELSERKEAARFNYDAAVAEFYPQVYLSGSMGKSQNDWPPEENNWSAGITVSVPVFEGGSNKAQSKKAKSQWDQAQAAEQSGRDSVVYTLEKTWKEFQDAMETVDVKKKFLEAALERAKIANAQYSSGLTTFDNWVIIEDNLVSAKKAYLDAQKNVLDAESYWIQAKGGTLEYGKA